MHVKWLRVAKSNLDTEVEYIAQEDYGTAIQGRVRQRGVNFGVLEVAIGQAALGGIWAGCASLGWVLSSAMASTCM